MKDENVRSLENKEHLRPGDIVLSEDICPYFMEQYYAYDKSASIVGYVRLKHGYFEVRCPDAGGDPCYEIELYDDDGNFCCKECRLRYLKIAKNKIAEWWNNGN